MAAEQGNRYAEKHSLEEWEDIFDKVYKRACKGEYTSLQQAWIKNDVRPSTATWLVKKYKVLASIKKDIGEAIIAVINDRGLEGDYNATCVIWRSKQLGEVDKQEIEQKTTTVELTPEERKERIEQLKSKM